MYQPLARKYRPETFSELVGQELVSTALLNSVRLGRAPQGVILTGVRGTGKTTTARLFSKALNCESPDQGAPCGSCVSCNSIKSGVHEDVLEIDGASNTGVDDVRRLIDSISYVPQRSKFKIYIIDEVHMLSNSAFNALLKTLEEPPSHVIFIFATTELAKVPETVLSRCQVYYMKKFSRDQLVANIKHILQNEKIDFDEEAVERIAEHGRGSMRDAITFLDHVISLGNGKVDTASVVKLMGRLSQSEITAFILCMLEKNVPQIIERIENWDELGLEVEVVLEQLLKTCRDMFVAQGKDQISDDFKPVLAVANKFDLNRVFRTLKKCFNDLDGSHIDRYTLENYCIEWCMDPGLPGQVALNSQPALSSQMASNSEPLVNRHSIVGPEAAISSSVNSQELLAEKKNKLGSMLNEIKQPAHKNIEKKKPTNTWVEIIETVSHKKPIFSKMLEEMVCISFEGRLLVLQIDPKMPSAKYIGAESSLKAKLNYCGIDLDVKVHQKTVSNSPEPALESELDKKKKHRKIQDEQTWNELKNASVTQYIVKNYGGTMQEIEPN